MAKERRKGWKEYMPTGVAMIVRVLVALVVIKFAIRIMATTVGAKIPASVARHIPEL